MVRVFIYTSWESYSPLLSDKGIYIAQQYKHNILYEKIWNKRPKGNMLTLATLVISETGLYISTSSVHTKDIYVSMWDNNVNKQNR